MTLLECGIERQPNILNAQYLQQAACTTDLMDVPKPHHPEDDGVLKKEAGNLPLSSLHILPHAQHSSLNSSRNLLQCTIQATIQATSFQLIYKPEGHTSNMANCASFASDTLHIFLVTNRLKQQYS